MRNSKRSGDKLGFTQEDLTWTVLNPKPNPSESPQSPLRSPRPSETRRGDLGKNNKEKIGVSVNPPNGNG